MTTDQRRKRYLRGILPNGDVVKIRTAAGYTSLVQHNDQGGRLTRHFFADTARKAAKPGDVIIGLTEGGLRDGDHVLSIIHGPVGATLTMTYPRCYACDKPGTGYSVRWGLSGLLGTVPACKSRHAVKEAS